MINYILVEFSQDSLFATSDLTGVDLDASIEKYASVLAGEIAHTYPTAEIDVLNTLRDLVEVDDHPDHEESAWVNQLVAKVYQEFNAWWVME